MYRPPLFSVEDERAFFALIDAHPFATLVTNGPGGLMANAIPFVVDQKRRVLRGHVARPNPVWKEMDGAREALVIFSGPDAYVTPSWYETKRESGKVVPTWNYAQVHVYGAARAVHDPVLLRAFVEQLTDNRERLRASPWRVGDAPDDFIEMQLRAIVGVEIALTRIEGKWKASQNRNDADRAGVAAGLRAEGCEAMARLVESPPK
ncbi:MAG: FMN-binding negative transcriptional regulator [Hyphomicrobiales bacterium]|nr:FMN-binding negative transcriptional regulator [Hyphomicrobiales bacterium]